MGWSLAISEGNTRDSIRMARAVLQYHQGEYLPKVSRKLVEKFYLKPLLEQSHT